MIRTANETTLGSLLALTIRPASHAIKRWIALRIVNQRLRDEWRHRDYLAGMSKAVLEELRATDKLLINLNSQKRDLERG